MNNFTLLLNFSKAPKEKSTSGRIYHKMS